MKRFILGGLVLSLLACDQTDNQTDGQTPSMVNAGTNRSGVDEALNDALRTDVIALAQEAGDASSEQCPNGGVVLELGVDTNGNGVLDSEEVTGNEVVCNGENGQAGPRGEIGPRGEAGPQGDTGPQGGQGEPGQPCTAEIGGDDYTITCPGSDPITIRDGNDGAEGPMGPQGGQGEPGQPCTAEMGGGDYTITCPGSDPITIRDGIDGAEGPMGPQGGQGEPGQPCTAEIGGDDYTITCPGSDPITIRDGNDGAEGPMGPQGGQGEPGQPCTAEMGGDDYTITCPGSDPITIRDGIDGLNASEEVLDGTLEGSFTVRNRLDEHFISGVTEITGTLTIEADGLSEVDISRIAMIGGSLIIIGGNQLESIEAQSLVTIGGDFRVASENDSITSIAMPMLTTVGVVEVMAQTALTSISMPSLESVDRIDFEENTTLINIDLSSLESAGFISVKDNPALTDINFPSLTSSEGIAIQTNDAITSIAFPVLTTVTLPQSATTTRAIEINEDSLVAIDFSALVSASSLSSIFPRSLYFRGDLLAECIVDALWDRIEDASTGDANISLNSNCVCFEENDVLFDSCTQPYRQQTWSDNIPPDSALIEGRLRNGTSLDDLWAEAVGLGANVFTIFANDYVNFYSVSGRDDLAKVPNTPGTSYLDSTF